VLKNSFKNSFRAGSSADANDWCLSCPQICGKMLTKIRSVVFKWSY